MLKANSKKTKSALYFGFDIISMSLSFFLSYVFFVSLEWQTSNAYEIAINSSCLIGITLVANIAIGLYKSKIRENFRNLLRRCILSAGLVLLCYEIIISTVNYQAHNLTLLLGLCFGAFLQALWRDAFIVRGFLSLTIKKVIFIGAGERASFITNRMRRKTDRKHFKGWEFISLDSINEKIQKSETILTDFSKTNYSEWLSQLSPDSVVLVLANDKGEELDLDGLLKAKMAGFDIVEFEDFIESEVGQLAVEKMSPEWLLRSEGFNINNPFYEKLNYVFNSFLALLVMTLTWPLMLGAIISIYLDDGKRDKAPFLYRQIRTGKDGKPFSILKFRSMGNDAEINGAQWASKNDTRVTRVGAYLRKYRIDELPQLINVLKGDMYFVGPRPERPEFIEELSKNIPFFNYRHLVKPGLTGWAQINYPYGDSEKDSFEKLKFDLYYIKHKSFMLDIFTLLRTVEVVLLGQGR